MSEAKEREHATKVAILVETLSNAFSGKEARDVADAIEALIDARIKAAMCPRCGTYCVDQEGNLCGDNLEEFHRTQAAAARNVAPRKAEPPAGGQRRDLEALGYERHVYDHANMGQHVTERCCEPQPSAEDEGAKPPGAAKADPPAGGQRRCRATNDSEDRCYLDAGHAGLCKFAWPDESDVGQCPHGEYGDCATCDAAEPQPSAEAATGVTAELHCMEEDLSWPVPAQPSTRTHPLQQPNPYQRVREDGLVLPMFQSSAEAEGAQCNCLDFPHAPTCPRSVQYVEPQPPTPPSGVPRCLTASGFNGQCELHRGHGQDHQFDGIAGGFVPLGELVGVSRETEATVQNRELLEARRAYAWLKTEFDRVMAERDAALNATAPASDLQERFNQLQREFDRRNGLWDRISRTHELRVEKLQHDLLAAREAIRATAPAEGGRDPLERLTRLYADGWALEDRGPKFTYRFSFRRNHERAGYHASISEAIDFIYAARAAEGKGDG